MLRLKSQKHESRASGYMYWQSNHRLVRDVQVQTQRQSHHRLLFCTAVVYEEEYSIKEMSGWDTEIEMRKLLVESEGHMLSTVCEWV